MTGSARRLKRSEITGFDPAATTRLLDRSATEFRLKAVPQSPLDVSDLALAPEPEATGSDPCPNEFDAILIDDAQTMAGLLTRASRNGARAFALVMHERASADHDGARLEFWATVLGMLPQERRT